MISLDTTQKSIDLVYSPLKAGFYEDTIEIIKVQLSFLS